MNVRYTPKGRASLDGMKPGDTREVSDKYYQQYADRLTLVEEIPSEEESERDAEEKDKPVGATEAIKLIGQISERSELSPFLKDRRKSVRQRAEARKRVLDADSDSQ